MGPLDRGGLIQNKSFYSQPVFLVTVLTVSYSLSLICLMTSEDIKHKILSLSLSLESPSLTNRVSFLWTSSPKFCPYIVCIIGRSYHKYFCRDKTFIGINTFSVATKVFLSRQNFRRDKIMFFSDKRRVL